jgi:hypothetical protein
MSTCTIVYYSFHFWAYKRLSLIPNISSLSTETENLKKKPTTLCKKNKFFSSIRLSFIFLVIFDWLWLIAYCCYIGLFLYIPVHYILAENYPIVTRMIILIEQVRFLMKSHAFVRENAPRAILYGQIYSQES